MNVQATYIIKTGKAQVVVTDNVQHRAKVLKIKKAMRIAELFRYVSSIKTTTSTK
jgi:hypothetical protein